MNYTFLVSYCFEKNGQSGHGALPYSVHIFQDNPGDRWTLSASTLNDWQKEITKSQGFDRVVILAVSPMFGHF